MITPAELKDRDDLIAVMERRGLLKPLPFSKYGPHEFIFGCCYTKDEADPTSKRKLIPDKAHIRLMIDRICVERIHPLLIPKSRRMVASWTCTAIEVYDAVHKPDTAQFIQSKKAEDSCELVDRHWFILCNLPEEFKVVQRSESGIKWANGLSVKRYMGGHGHTSKLEFSNGSHITAVAEGADQLRQYAASRIRQEEIAFWGIQELSYDAAIECTQASAGAMSGGQLIAVTTANPSWFGDFVHDRETDNGKRVQHKLDIHTPIPGVREWRTSVGANVLEIHYKADPEKANAEWIHREKFESGRRIRGWDREMEIRWDVYAGMPVFGDCFNQDIHISKEPLVWDGESRILRAWDYGNTPACTISTLESTRGGMQWKWLTEICTDTRPLGSKEPPPASNISQFSDRVLAYCHQEYPDAEYFDVDDPAGTQKSQTDGRSCRSILQGKGINPIGGEISKKGRIESLADWLSRLVGGKPALVIDEGKCPMLCEALRGGYRYQEIGQTGRYSEDPEKNQFSHPMDTSMYMASRITEDLVQDDTEARYDWEQGEVDMDYSTRGSSLY